MDEYRFKLQKLYQLSDLSKITNRIDLIQAGNYTPLTLSEGDSQEDINLKILLDLFTIYENLCRLNNSPEVDSIRTRISPLIEKLMKEWGYEFDKSMIAFQPGYDSFDHVSIVIVSNGVRNDLVQDRDLFYSFKRCFVKAVEL